MGGYLFQQNYGFQVGDYLKKSMTYQREIIHTDTRNQAQIIRTIVQHIIQNASDSY